jgi:Ca2+-binding RTX toxin-like protein
MADEPRKSPSLEAEMAIVLGNTNNGNVNLFTDDTLYIQNSDTDFILQSGDDAIDVFASGTELIVRGTVGSDTHSGINVDSGESNNSIVVASTGIVSGQLEGIEVNGTSTTIVNNGKIFGVDEGIDFQPTSTDNVLINFGEIVGLSGGVDTFNSTNNRIYNHGQIIGTAAAGVFLDGDGSLLHNTGEIAALGGDAGVVLSTETGETASLFNSGTISGSDFLGNAVVGGTGDDTVINQGTINGNVALGGGNDVFNGTGGTVNGTVFGGAGDDIYIVDDPTLTLVENPGEGIDTVFANTGWTLGANFENLNLVGDGDHTGVGNNLDNVINGNIGDNTLSGGAGNDLLRGGEGNDTLFGGPGDDRLVGGPGDDFLHGGGGADNLLGGAGDDVLRGGAGDDRLAGGPGSDSMFGGSGDDRLLGGSGQDALVGGLGQDVLIGGPDADRFVYNSVQESPVGAANRDRINDFSSAQGDRIDLSGIDADVNTGGDDSFTFIGTSGFSGSAGELRFVNVGPNILVTGDVDGDGIADFEIFVNNTATLSASDFIL